MMDTLEMVENFKWSIKTHSCTVYFVSLILDITNFIFRSKHYTWEFH